MKIGILGGTFDPPHNAHIELALFCKKKFNLDKIMFLPLGDAPHKKDVTKKEIRLKMLESAICEQKDFFISLKEIKREGKTYTFDTLSMLDKDNEYFYLIGGDTLKTLHTWYRAHDVFKMTKFIMVERPGVETKKTIAEENGAFVLRAQYIAQDISSTKIREMIKNKQDVSTLIPPKTLEVITKNGLYTN